MSEAQEVVTALIDGEQVTGRITLRTVHRIEVTITHPYRWLFAIANVPGYAAKGVGYLGPNGPLHAHELLARLLRTGRYLEQALPTVAEALRADERQLARFTLLLRDALRHDVPLDERTLHAQAERLELTTQGILPPLTWQEPYVNAHAAHQANVLLWHALQGETVDVRAHGVTV